MLTAVLKNLIYNLSTLIIVAYFISRIKIFKNLVTEKKNTLMEKLFLSVIFGCIGIFATYTGVSVNGAIANSRIVGVMVGGIWGGPLVGLGAGIIAGLHRWSIDIGGFTAVACAISTILEGLIGGLASKYIKNLKYNWAHAFFIGLFAEVLQMLIILIVAKPYGAAVELVEIIWLPMVLFNPIGIAIFVALIEGIYRDQENEAAIQTQLALNIAEQCLPYLRKGLSDSGAVNEVAKIILSMTGAAAVALTDKKNILAHVGIGEDHHTTNSLILTSLTRDALDSGELRIGQTRDEIGCSGLSCRLRSVIVAPLLEKGEVVGTIKIYKTRENGITYLDTRLVVGLAKLFSTQLELADIDYQVKLREKAELKALQSQINPHFLFNALNTIVSFCRTKPDKARELLISLSTYFRNTLQQSDDFISLETELMHVNAYLAIEKARFEDKLEVEIEIEENIECILPQLILQPIVENAVKHGLLKQKDGGSVRIKAVRQKNGTLITVEDSGKGIDEEIVERLYNDSLPKSKVGLSNINNRLKSIYGENYGLRIHSRDRGGTIVELRIPDRIAGENI